MKYIIHIFNIYNIIYSLTIESKQVLPCDKAKRNGIKTQS